MQSTSLFLLNQWADSRLRKFLLDKFRFFIGQLVLNEQIEAAKYISNLSLEVLEYADLFFTLQIKEDQFKQQLCRIHPRLSQYADEISRTPIYSSTLFAEDGYYNSLSNAKTNHHIVVICGLWTEPRQPTKSHIVYLKTEFANSIWPYLISNNLLTSETQNISIASNTIWAGHRTSQSIDNLFSLCKFIHNDYPDIKIRFVGFYDKGATHLESFNARLKELCDYLYNYVEYISFESLLEPNEIQKNASGSIRSLTFRTMLERLCEW